MGTNWFKIILFAAFLIGGGNAVLAAKCDLPANAVKLATDAGRVMNAKRAKAGLKALVLDEKLQAAAFAHACDMSKRGYFSHQGKDGSNHAQRLKRQGCAPKISAENIAAGHTQAQPLIDAWMTSRGHRKNIMIRRGADRYGVGLAHSGKAYAHGFVWVMVFSSPCRR